MKLNFRAKLVKQGENRIIIVPIEYRAEVEQFTGDLLSVMLKSVKGDKEMKEKLNKEVINEN